MPPASVRLRTSVHCLVVLIVAALSASAASAGAGAGAAAHAVPAQPRPTRQRSEPPPEAYLTVGNETQQAGIGTYCWDGACRDTWYGWIAPTASLRVAASPVRGRLRIAAPITPTQIDLDVQRFERRPAVRADDDFTFWPGEWARQVGPNYLMPLRLEQDVQLARPAGLYVISLDVFWQDVGDAFYAFLVQVEE